MAPSVPIGTVLGAAWRVERVLGGGGMGTVYACRHVASGHAAAVKILQPHVAQDAVLRARFVAEGSAIARVAHPGVVRMFGTGTHEGAPFLIMELIGGPTLRQLARTRGGVLTVAELVPLVDRLLEVLGAVHAAGVVHRDVKPENVIVADDGATRLVDFGIARVDDGQGLTSTGGIVGTPAFMAPEQLLGKMGAVDARTDLFAVGALVWRLVTGKNVHDDCSGTELVIAMATRPAPSLATVAPHLPRAVIAVVDRALSFEAQGRFPDAAAMRTAWRAAAAQAGAAEGGPPPSRVERRAIQRQWVVASGLVIAVAVAVAAVGVVATRGSSEAGVPHGSSGPGGSPAMAGPPAPAAPPEPGTQGACSIDVVALRQAILRVVGHAPTVENVNIRPMAVSLVRNLGSSRETFIAMPASAAFERTHVGERLFRTPPAVFGILEPRSLEPTSFRALCIDAERRFAATWNKPGVVNLVEIDLRRALFAVDSHPQSEAYCYQPTTLAPMACFER